MTPRAVHPDRQNYHRMHQRGVLLVGLFRQIAWTGEWPFKIVVKVLAYLARESMPLASGCRTSVLAL